MASRPSCVEVVVAATHIPCSRDERRTHTRYRQDARSWRNDSFADGDYCADTCRAIIIIDPQRDLIGAGCASGIEFNASGDLSRRTVLLEMNGTAIH